MSNTKLLWYKLIMPQNPDVWWVPVRIKDCRQSKGLSCAALADICGLHENSVRNAEREGSNNTRLVTLWKIARGLGKPLHELVREPR